MEFYISGFGASDFDPNLVTAYFTGEGFGVLAFPAAAAVFQGNTPAMPGAYDLPLLNDPFAQRKAQMRTEILDGEHTLVPLENGDVQAIRFDRVS